MEGRPIVRETTLAEYKAKAELRSHATSSSTRRCIDVGRAQVRRGYQWGMAIDSRTPAPAATPAWSPARRKTTSRSSARSRSPRGREMHWMRIDRYYAGDPTIPTACSPADELPALRERPVRAGLPGGRHRPQRRGAQRDGLQPLHRHALLLEQLPVQGAPLQLLRCTTRLPGRRAEDGAQPGRDGPHARRHGEVHLLRPAHQRRQDRRQERWPRSRATARSRPPARRPARPRRSSSATSTIRRAAWPS